MSKRAPKPTPLRPAAPRAAAKSPHRDVPPATLALGAVLLLAATAMSAMLVIKHISGLHIPGCGAGSACDELDRSVWGKIPWVDWPVSFFGLAYFAATLVVWLGSRHGLSNALRNTARLSVLGSVGFTVIMLIEKHLCPYCIGVHLANVTFWIVTESVRARRPASPGLVAAGLALFAAVSLVVGFVDHSVRGEVARKAERERAESAARIIAGAQPAPPTTSKPLAPSPSPGSQAAAPESGPAADDPFRDGFRGRYLLGPEKAAVRIVIFTDYQCRDCKAKEAEIETLLQRHPDVSFSVKQFPFDQSCNPTADRTLHQNACWAARAAEAAGILWGDTGFFAMHRWLFAHEGRFLTTQELEAGIREIGFDPAGFVQVMTGDETLRRIHADIEEAHLLGLFQTPMIFINGVELRGWNAPDAVIRTVEQVLATHPEPRTHAGDHPPLSIEKCVGDWREQPTIPMPPDQTRWPLGPDDAKVKIVVFGDYQEPTTSELDKIIRDWLQGRADAQYVFRHFPFDRECNPHVPKTLHDRACWAARAAEAAGKIAGNAGYWRLHVWLLSHQAALNEPALRQAADALTLDVDALLAAMQTSEVQGAVREDADATKALGLNTIPTLYINNKLVVRWRYLGAEKGREIVRAILDAAATNP